MDITDFLLQRIAEDQAMAERERMWTHGPASWALEGMGDGYSPGISIDPRRVLAECDSKRKIVEACSDYNYEPTEEQLNWNTPEGNVDQEIASNHSRRLLHILALPFADHADFDPSWELPSE